MFKQPYHENHRCGPSGEASCLPDGVILSFDYGNYKGLLVSAKKQDEESATPQIAY